MRTLSEISAARKKTAEEWAEQRLVYAPDCEAAYLAGAESNDADIAERDAEIADAKAALEGLVLLKRKIAMHEEKLKVAVEDLEWIEYRSETARHRVLASGLRPTMASPNQIAMHAREALIRLRARK